MLRNLIVPGTLILALGVTTAPIARASDQTILGNQLLVKNPSTPDKRHVVAKAKEKGSPNTLAGDPVMSGATLTITLDGGTPSQQTYSLPTGQSGLTGKSFWSGDAIKGFK